MKNIIIFLTFLIIGTLGFAQHIDYRAKIIGGSYNYKLVFDQEFYYPEAAIKAGAEGEVIATFNVDVDGFAKEFVIIQSVHPKLDTAFIKVLKRLIWEPGTRDGAHLKSQVRKSQKFKIKKYHKLCQRRGYIKPPYSYEPYSSDLSICKYKTLQKAPQPIYKNKEVNIFKFIQEYIKIPDAAVKQGITGVVEISFIVESSGRLSNFKEINGIGGGCTEEAYRLMQLLEWKPGMIHDEYIRSEYQIKVNFGNSKY